jgi:hypothetical protein
VVIASAISFGFVFVHPFKDGNGRLHRYLIHEQLSTAGFTPKGIVLPVSAVILANIERTVAHDLDDEISYLLGFDRARQVLASISDWPSHSLDLFIRVVRQNGGKLSAAKRGSHFSWMTDDEVKRFEVIVDRAFTAVIAAEDIAATES